MVQGKSLRVLGVGRSCTSSARGLPYRGGVGLEVLPPRRAYAAGRINKEGVFVWTSIAQPEACMCEESCLSPFILGGMEGLKL